MSQISLLNLASGPESLFDKTKRFLPDIRKHRSQTESSDLEQDLALFTKEALAERPGMSWLNTVELQLYHTLETDVEAQKAQLTHLKETLKANAVYFDSTFSEVFPEGFREPVIVLDLETTGLDMRILYDAEGNLKRKVEIVGVCLAISSSSGVYLPLRHTGSDGVKNWSEEAMIPFLDEIHQEFLTVYHNANYDREAAAINGVVGLRPFPYFLDTMLLDFLQSPGDKGKGLKKLSKTLLGRTMIEIGHLFNENAKGNVLFNQISASNAYVYGASDAVNTYALLELAASKPANVNVFLNQRIPLEIDHKMVDCLRDLCRTGCPIDFEYIKISSLDIIHRISLIQEKIYALSDEEWNIGSPSKVSFILFDVFKLVPLAGMKRGKKDKNSPDGMYSTKQDLLEELNEKYPSSDILNYILYYRKLNDVLSKTFLKMLCNSYVDFLVPYTRVYLSYSQVVIPTGRLSSSASGGRERVKVNTKVASLTKSYSKDSWGAGFNSQGVSSSPFVEHFARKVKKLPKAAGLNLGCQHPDSVKVDLIKRASSI